MRSYKVQTTPFFEASIRRLSHKYRHIRQDIEEVILAIEKSPTNAVAIPGYAQRLWKRRARNRDAKAGKRGGYRIIYFWQPNNEPRHWIAFNTKMVGLCRFA